MKNNRKVGTVYEEQAVSFLSKQGYQVIEKNYYCRMGEIDIIAWSPFVDGERYLVFIEVKYRKSSQGGYPEEAVDLHKQKKIIKTARHYLAYKKFDPLPPCRFDVIAIEGRQCRHIIDAFGVSDINR